MHNISISSFVYIVAVSIFSAIYILPSVRIFFDYVSLAMVSCLFYVIFIYKKDKFLSISRIFINLLPYMIISFLVAKPMDFKMGFLHPLLTTWCMLFPGVLCKDILEKGDKLVSRSIAFITMSMFMYVVYNSINALIKSPDILREIAGNILEKEILLQYILSNVGGYGLAYGAGSVIILLIIVIERKPSNKLFKYVLFILLAIVSYFVFNAQFTTLLFLTIICVVISLYYSDYGQRNKLFLIFLTIIFVLFIPLLLQFTATIYEGTTIGYKLDRFINAIFGSGNTIEASGARSESQFAALKLFIDSPIWGSNISSNVFNADVYMSSHSTLLSVACSTGLIGLISYYKTYFGVIIPVFRDYFGKGNQYLSIIIYFFFFSLFNPSESTEACWIIFMIVPLLFNVMNQIIEENEYSC